MIVVSVKGVKRARNFYNQLPKEMEKQVKIAGTKFNEVVRDMARRRAPVYTGNLKNSIKIERIGKGKNEKLIISADVPYAKFQEAGFKGHFVSANTPDREGRNIRKWMAAKGLSGSGVFVQKFTPFLVPSLEYGITRLPTYLQEAATKATGEADK